MSKYLVVEAELLGQIMNCEQCPAVDHCTEKAAGDSSCFSSEAECVDLLLRYGAGKVRPLTAAEEKAGELHKAAFAYQKLAVCYRVGKRPTEKLFTELEKANKLLSTLAEQEQEPK